MPSLPSTPSRVPSGHETKSSILYLHSPTVWPKDIIQLSGYPLIQDSLSHAGFYMRFIKDFSKISRPLTNLLEKDVPFVFYDDCVEAFEILKKALVSAPIVQPPDWNYPLKLCVMLAIML